MKTWAEAEDGKHAAVALLRAVSGTVQFADRKFPDGGLVQMYHVIPERLMRLRDAPANQSFVASPQ